MDLIVVLYIIQGEFSVNYQSPSKEHPRSNIVLNSLIYFLQFDNIVYFVWHLGKLCHINNPLFTFSPVIFKHHHWIESIKLRNGKSDIRSNISHVKKVSKKSPTAEKILNHVSKTWASNIDLTFVNETIKQLIAKNKINDDFKIIVEPEHGNLNQSTNEVQTDEFNETLDGSPTAPQFVDEKELETLLITTIANKIK